MTHVGAVSGLIIYPVKGSRRVELTEAMVEPRGLAGDRRWMITNEAGRFISQREYSVLALLEAQVQGDQITLNAPLQEPITLTPDSARPITVQVWNSIVEAWEAPEATAWLTHWLGFPARLAYMHEHSDRPVSDIGDQVSFADGYPILIANEASLADLNGRLGEPIPMSRFRPNIVVTGAEAFAEDHWQSLRIGEVRFRGVKPCARCNVTTIDQETGIGQGKEPLTTLATFRQVEQKVMFGHNLIPESTGMIRVGDAVFVET